jgi:hypothetical protein
MMLWCKATTRPVCGGDCSNGYRENKNWIFGWLHIGFLKLRVSRHKFKMVTNYSPDFAAPQILKQDKIRTNPQTHVGNKRWYFRGGR